MPHPETEALVRLVTGEAAADPRTLTHVLTCPRCGRQAAELAAVEVRHAGPEGWRSYARIWGHVAKVQARTEEALARDREESLPLLLALFRLPKERQREAAAAAPRFHSPGLAALLLDSAEDAAGMPDFSEDMAVLALEVAAGAAARVSGGMVREAQARGWLWIAEARRRRVDLAAAEEAIGRARYWLEAGPLDHPARAEYCLRLALLRRDQEQVDEALGLLARAVALADGSSCWRVAAEARITEGWILLEEGDPEDAAWVLEVALELLDPMAVPHRALRAYHGLALAYADLAYREAAQSVLERSRRVHGLLYGWSRFQVLAGEARIEERCGRWAEAMDKLEQAVSGLVKDECFQDAAIAGVRLAQLYGEQRRTASLPALARTLTPALGSRWVSLRAKTLVAALLRLAAHGTEHLPGLFEESAAWLERARHNPNLPLPARGGARAALMWDDLNRATRRKVCARAGFPQDFSLRPVETIEPEARDVLTWIHEALTRIRIDFEVVG